MRLECQRRPFDCGRRLLGCASQVPDRPPEDPGRDVPGDLAEVGLESERDCRSGIGTAAPCVWLRPQADSLRLDESGQLHTAPDRPLGEPGALYKYRTTRLGGHLLGGVEEPPVAEQRDVEGGALLTLLFMVMLSWTCCSSVTMQKPRARPSPVCCCWRCRCACCCNSQGLARQGPCRGGRTNSLVLRVCPIAIAGCAPIAVAQLCPGQAPAKPQLGPAPAQPQLGPSWSPAKLLLTSPRRAPAAPPLLIALATCSSSA